MTLGVLAFLAACQLLASFIRATVGFADALVAVPLMALVVGPKFAAPLMSLCSATMGLVLLATDWRRVDLREAFPLIVGGLLGLGPGVLLLEYGDRRVLTLVLGLFLLAFCAYEAFFARAATERRAGRGAGYGFGFVAGVFGGMFTTPGPPVAAYGRLSGWPADRFRAMVTGFALPFGVTVATTHGCFGYWTRDVLLAYACVLPAIAVGFVLGNALHHRVPADTFRRLIRLGLVAIGVSLVAKAGWG